MFFLFISKIDMSNIIDQAQRIVSANGFQDGLSASVSLVGSAKELVCFDSSHHPCEGKIGRHGTPHPRIRYHHIRVDGLFLALRIHARYRSLGTRQVSQSWRSHIPR
jgi:hypothetical protein